jgi:type IV secretory pathway TrbD component
MADGAPREGLYSRVYHGLIQHDLLGGVPKKFATLNLTTTLALLQGTKLYWLALVGVGLHLLARWATKRDPYWMTIWIRYIKTYRYYDV